jgi:uncharacterized protein
VSARIVIAGASGFVGTRLAERHRAQGDTVLRVGRTGADARWDDPAALRRAVDGSDLVVNLAGKSVDCRYGDANRAEIFRSRVETTRAIREAILAVDAPPAAWFNASTATIYRHAEDRPMTESGGELGTGFSVEVAKAWEAELFAGELPGTSRVALRMAIVLGDGSALVPLANLARFGLGGPQRDGRWFSGTARRNAGTFHEAGARGGRQRFSWIHVQDVLDSIAFLSARPDLSGAVNLAAPHPVDNRTLMATIRRVLGIPFGLPADRWMLEVGSAVIRTETELVLKSRWVLPERLLDAGYEFAFPELEPALRSLLGDRGLLRRASAG